MSEKGAIKKSTAQAICDAVKVKEGTTEGVPFKDVAERILALPTASGENKLPQYFNKTLTELTAEDLLGTTTIRKEAFLGFYALTSVIISNSVTSIGEKAFYQNTKLEHLTIGNGVVSIAKQAFAYSNKINNDLIIPESVESIGDSAFMECKQLPSVTLNGGGNIETYAFYYCDAIKTITIGNGVTSIGSQAFGNCHSLTTVTIPDSVTNLQNAFGGCKALITMTVGSGLTIIHSYAFRYLENLANFIINSPITSSVQFNESTKLTIDSLKNIINALVDYSGTENDGKYKLTLNSTCNATLEAEGATAPNGLTWSEYVTAKGWLLA